MRLLRLPAVVVVALLVAATAAPPAAAAPPTFHVRVVQRGLANPWDVAFAPDGRMLVTERPGRVRVYASGAPGARLLATRRLKRVRAEGEAGVMGIATARRGGTTFAYVCASRTTRRGWRNQVLRYRLRASALRFDGYVVRWGMRAASRHNGCAVEVGPDGKVWVTMGDAADTTLPQRRDRLNGKVLRLNHDGSVPADNPHRGSPVYSSGHRNPQGITFRPGTQTPYVVEHGPDVHDELNRIVPGGNYGWPCWTGAATPGPAPGSRCRPASAYRRPAWSSGGSTVATSGVDFARGRHWGDWRGDLLVATLKQSDVRRLVLRDAGRRAVRRGSPLLDGSFGRLRAMVSGPGSRRPLFVTTSNGTGDRVVRLTPR